MILNGTLQIDGIQKWVFPIVTADGDKCEFSHVAPKGLVGAELDTYLSGQEDSYKLDILKDMYPGAVIPPSETLTPLQAFEAWIASGHQIPVLDPDGRETLVVITKVPWTQTHPEDMEPVLESAIALRALEASDKKMARVCEDLVSAILAAGLLPESDLPPEVMGIINERKNLRGLI